MSRIAIVAALVAFSALAQQPPAPAGDTQSGAAPSGDAQSGVAPAGDTPAPTPAPAAATPGAATPADPQQPPKPMLVVMDVEGKGVSELEAQAATTAVVRGLRELDTFQVMSSDDVRQLLAIERSRQLLGNQDGPGKLQDLSKIFGAQHAVAGTMTRVGDGLAVEIRLLDSKQSNVLAQKALGPVANIEAVAVALPGLSQELLGPLLEAQRGGLLIETNEEAAEVFVDDVLVGSTPMKSPVKLARGTHRVQLRKDGFIAQSKSVVILPEQVKVETFRILPSADYAEAYAMRHGRLRTGAWIATGVAVASLTGAFLVDRFGTEPIYQTEFLPRQLALNGVTTLPTAVESDTVKLERYYACGANVPLCKVELDQFGGTLFATQATTVGLGVIGVAATATATYLFLSGKDPNRYANVVAGFVPSLDGGAFVFSGTF